MLLTNAKLLAMLAASELAHKFFLDAGNGLFQDNQFHDLYYDSTNDQLLTKTFHHQHEANYSEQQQPICRITNNTLQDYEQFLGHNMNILDMSQWYTFALHEYHTLEQELTLQKEPGLEL